MQKSTLGVQKSALWLNFVLLCEIMVATDSIRGLFQIKFVATKEKESGSKKLFYRRIWLGGIAVGKKNTEIEITLCLEG